MKKVIHYINERRISFSFSVGSIIYGLYHYYNPHVLSTSEAYKTINYMMGVVGGRYFGLAFIVLGAINIYSILTNHKNTRLSTYFSLLFAWSLLALCFYIAHRSGGTNAAWIYISMAMGMSTGVIDKPLKDVFDG